MPMLFIGEVEQRRIAELIANAKAHPVPLSVIKQGKVDWTDTLKLEDRKPGFERPPSQHMIFPGDYRAAFSYEEQPIGLCSHLSISVFNRTQKGMMPSPQAVAMIAKEFGVPFPPDQAWQEEFEPGEYAINLLSAVDRSPVTSFRKAKGIT